MGIEIEDGIPVPPSAGRSGKYKWNDLAVGQSFFVKDRDKKLIVPKRLKPRKFDQRTGQTNDKGETGLRVWRVV